MKTENKQRFYYPELDGLRFIAFLLVFIHNAPYIESSKGWALLHDYGWIGVDLFFCLSAFLITKLLDIEHEREGKINIASFYMRRILRIWPLYFFYIILIILFPVLLQRNNNYEFMQIAGLATFTFNFVYAYLFPIVITLFIHLWTISFEEQFYLVIPWSIRGITRVVPKTRMGILTIIFLLASAIRAIFIYLQFKHPAIYILPFARFEALLGGMAIGLGLFDNLFHNIKSWILFLLGVALNSAIFALPKIYEINWYLMLSYLFVGAGMSLILFSVTRKESSLLRNLLSNPPTVYLGKISYGLYVFHLISIRLANQIYDKILSTNHTGLADRTVLVFITGLMITIIISILSYNLIEKPFLRLKEKFSLVKSHPL